MVYVSCTTTKNRLKLFYYCYQSLKRQSLAEYKIILNISKEAYLFDDGIDVLPEWLHGEDIIVKWVQNTGPYRKLLPLINEVDDNDMVVTADDDILYDENWLKSLVEASIKHPEMIIASRGRIIRRTFYGAYKNYRQWTVWRKAAIGMRIFPVGCGGIVYRKPLIDLDFINDPSFKSLSPTSDDIWFRVSTMITHTKVCLLPYIDELNVSLLHKFGMFTNNNSIVNRNKPLYKVGFSMGIDWIMGHLGINSGQNDKHWDAVLQYAHKKYALHYSVLFEDKIVCEGSGKGTN